MNDNNIYNILNKFNALTKETPVPVKQEKPKSPLQESMEQVLTRKLSEGKKKGDGNLANNAKPYDKVTRGDVIAGRLGKDEKGGKAKKVGEAAQPTLPSKKAEPVKKKPMTPFKSKEQDVQEAKDKCTCEDSKKTVKSCPVHDKDVVAEKAVSKAQQKFMGMVHAAQKGGKAASPEVAKAAKGMSKKAAKDYASTKHKGLPQHVKEAVQDLLSQGWTTEQIVEGWEDMMKSVAKRHKDEKGTGKFNKEKTATGTKYTRKYDAKSGESDDTGKDGEGEKAKRGRGRPRKSAFESKTLAGKMINESFASFLEGSIQGGVWTADPPKKGQPNVPVPQNPEVAKPTPKVAPAAKPAADMGSAAAALMAPNKVDPKAKVIPSDPEGVKEEGGMAVNAELEEMMRLAGLGEVSKGQWIKQQDAAAEKSGKKSFNAFGQSFSTDEVDEEQEMEGNAFGAAVARAKSDGVHPGEKVNVGGKSYPVKEDIDLEECGAMSAMGNGMMGQESEGKMNITTNMSSDGNKNVTINADGNAAVELMQMLKLAGLQSGAGQEEQGPETQDGPEGVLVVAHGEEGREEDAGEESEDGEVAEEKDTRYQASTTPDEHVMPTQVQTKGGDGDDAGGEKAMHKHGYQFGDNPMAMKESVKLMRDYESIKVKK